MGTANSCSVIQHYGAKNILLRYKELIKSMKKLNVKISRKKYA